jgi:predicted dehydrogenase
MRRINVGVIGLGWIGTIRAETCAASPFVQNLRLADLRPERLADVGKATGAQSTMTDYHELLDSENLDAVIISAAPEDARYQMARDSLRAGKHVLVEKPMALSLHEADELIDVARAKNLKFSVGYSQRFNPKFAYVRKCAHDGTIGTPITALVSRSVGREIPMLKQGRAGERTNIPLVMMGCTHDLDFILWCLEPRKPVRVYAQTVNRVIPAPGMDCQWITVTMDDGISFVIGSNSLIPPSHVHVAATWIQFMGTEGTMFVDDTHRDVTVSTMKHGIYYPMATMPGERVEHTYSGPLESETRHFIEAVACDKPVLVKAEQARQVLEVCFAADLSANRNEPVRLPLPESRSGNVVA